MNGKREWTYREKQLPAEELKRRNRVLVKIRRKSAREVPQLGAAGTEVSVGSGTALLIVAAARHPDLTVRHECERLAVETLVAHQALELAEAIAGTLRRFPGSDAEPFEFDAEAGDERVAARLAALAFASGAKTVRVVGRARHGIHGGALLRRSGSSVTCESALAMDGEAPWIALLFLPGRASGKSLRRASLPVRIAGARLEVEIPGTLLGRLNLADLLDAAQGAAIPGVEGGPAALGWTLDGSEAPCVLSLVIEGDVPMLRLVALAGAARTLIIPIPRPCWPARIVIVRPVQPSEGETRFPALVLEAMPGHMPCAELPLPRPARWPSTSLVLALAAWHPLPTAWLPLAVPPTEEETPA